MKAYKKRGELFNDVVIPLPDNRTLRCRLWKGGDPANPHTSSEKPDEFEMQWHQVEISDELVEQLQTLERAYREAKPAIRFLTG